MLRIENMHAVENTKRKMTYHQTQTDARFIYSCISFNLNENDINL